MSLPNHRSGEKQWVHMGLKPLSAGEIAVNRFDLWQRGELSSLRMSKNWTLETQRTGTPYMRYSAHNFLHFTFCWPSIVVWFLVNDQRDAQFFSKYLFLFLTLYMFMFRAHHAHHQERQIVSTQPLVTVTLCWWACLVQVGSSLPTCT